MNDPTRPPLYAYKEAYKAQLLPRRRNRFSDTDYNYIVTHISRVIPATDDHYFNIKTSDPRGVRKLLKKTGILNPAVMTVNLASGTILVQYSLNKNGKDQRNDEMEKLQKIVAGGTIVEYGKNPLKDAKNQKGDTVVGLTEVNNQSQTVAKVDPNGQLKFLSEDQAQKYLEEQEKEEEVRNQTKNINYILGAVAVVAIIVMIWVVKKNK